MARPAGDAQLARNRERPPRLVLRFAILAALGIAAAAAVILVVTRHADTARAQAQAIDRARFAVRAVLAPELRARDLSRPAPDQRRHQLDRLFASRILIEGVRDGTIYGRHGRATYSTATPAGAAGRVREALAGTVVSEVATAADGSRVLRTYVPVGVGGRKIAGVVLLDQEYAQIEAAVRRSSYLIAGVLEGLLLLLFVIFAPLLARVSSRIRDHVDELERVATHDELTGLPNRLALRRAGDELVAGNRRGALLLADLDGFSEINDCLGLEAGDALLVQLAERLRTDLADSELVARLGEDEFGFLLDDVGREQVPFAAERIRRSLATPFVVAGVRVSLGVGIGAALVPDHGPEFDAVLRRAGAALSIAKVEGRSSVQLYDSTHDTSDASRLAFAGELREALDGGQLLLHYQPQADLATQQIRGVEALLRWQHPQRGLLPAGEFIAYAERSGLVRELRNFVLETAGAGWQRFAALKLDIELAVNLSPADMLDDSLPDEIADLLARYAIPPWNLILEITERTLIGDERRARLIVERLSDIGVRLAVDDFGTGYSSLASLRKFPVDQVKLDRSLLQGVPGDAAAEAIVAGSVEIAHGVGATVVAEGIETREQWRFAALMGCDVAQGYLIGKPAPAAKLAALLDVPRLAPVTVA